MSGCATSRRIRRGRVALASHASTDDRRYKCTRGLRQVLDAAQRWGDISRNPAVDIGANQASRGEELQPFTRRELAAIVGELTPRDAAIVTFAAETRLRTNECPALDRRDVDWHKPAVLRPTFATEALAAGVSIFQLARSMAARRSR